MQMEPSTKAPSKITTDTAKARSLGPMDHSTKVVSNTTLSRGKETKPGLITQNTISILVNSQALSSLAMVSCITKTVVITRGNLSTDSVMAKARSPGLMEQSTRVISRITNSRGREFKPGPITQNTSLIMENS